MFEVGQKVWDVFYGEGVITSIENASHYPVAAAFSDGMERTYAADGKFVKSNEAPSLYPYPVEIVKKVVKPSINWEHVSGEYKYLAEDSNGAAFLYEKEPFLSLDSWGIQGGEASVVRMFASYIPGTCNWKDSLVTRPD